MVRGSCASPQDWYPSAGLERCGAGGSTDGSGGRTYARWMFGHTVPYRWRFRRNGIGVMPNSIHRGDGSAERLAPHLRMLPTALPLRSPRFSREKEPLFDSFDTAPARRCLAAIPPCRPVVRQPVAQPSRSPQACRFTRPSRAVPLSRTPVLRLHRRPG